MTYTHCLTVYPCFKVSSYVRPFVAQNAKDEGAVPGAVGHFLGAAQLSVKGGAQLTDGGSRPLVTPGYLKFHPGKPVIKGPGQ